MTRGKRRYLLALVAGMVEHEQWGPPVCPGCHAVGVEPCPSWCPDREMQEDWEIRMDEREPSTDEELGGPE